MARAVSPADFKNSAGLSSGHPNVEKFYPAAQNEGGAGATTVELKE